MSDRPIELNPPAGLYEATEIYCTLTFEGFHRWLDAPQEVAFLRSYHRHVFHVTAAKRVTHDDRDIEFILLKREIEAAISQVQNAHNDVVSEWSCEHWAKWIGRTFACTRVSVSEDGENGAIWHGCVIAMQNKTP